MEDECSGRGNSPRRQNEITGFGSMCSIEDSCEDLSHRTLDFEPSRNRIGENISMDFFNDMMGMVVDITQDWMQWRMVARRGKRNIDWWLTGLSRVAWRQIRT